MRYIACHEQVSKNAFICSGLTHPFDYKTQLRGNYCVAMKLDVAPQVVSAFPTAEEQNQCLAVVNAAINELNRNAKSTQEMGKAMECTYIVAAGRCLHQAAPFVCASL